MKFLKAICSILFTCFTCIHVHAQDAPEQGGFRHISVRDGLPSTEVYRIIQDKKGYLWMCTDAGVCRYNGISFTYYTTHEGLSDNTVFRIVEGNDGKIWVQGFSGALSYFDGQKFIQPPVNDSLRTLYSNGQRVSYCMTVDAGGNVSVGGLYTDGCYRILAKEGYKKLHRFFSPGNAVLEEREVWTDAFHNVYSFSSNLAASHRGNVFHNGHQLKLDFPENPSSATNNRMMVTHDNKLLYSYLNRVYFIDGNGEVRTRDFAKSVISLDEDIDGNIWVGLFYGGVEMIPGGDLSKPMRHFFGNKSIGSVFRDNEGGYWLSTVGEGIYYLPNINVGYLTSYNGLPANTIMSLAAYPGNRVVIGLPNSQVALFDPSRDDDRRLLIGIAGKKKELSTEALIVKGKEIFVNTDGNYLLDSNLHLIREIPYKSHEKGVVRDPRSGAFFEYSQSDIVWIGSDLAIDSTQSVHLRFTCALIDTKGNYWLGALNGLWCIRNGSPYYFSDSLPELKVRIDDMTEDRNGNIWMATRGDGVIVMSGTNIYHFSSEDGLTSNTCRTITSDNDGNVWIGTNRGISLISQFQGSDGSAVFNKYFATDGILSNEVREIVVTGDMLWIGSNEGLCWYKTGELRSISSAPPVYIVDVMAGEKHFGEHESPALDYGTAPLRVFLDALYFRDPAGLKFRYRLAGTEEDWLVTNNRELTFSGLAPGNYTLEIYAINNSGNLSPIPAILHFSILPPFWKSWWFISLSILFFVGMVLLVASWRVRSIRKKRDEKAAMEKRVTELRLSALRAQMNPHFIFNAINSIQHFVLQNDSDKAYSYLSKFSRLIRLVLDQSRSDLVPIDQELDILKIYVELEKLRFARQFRFELTVDPWLEEHNVKIPGMLIQPFVENSIWHGLLPKQEGEALVSVRMNRVNEQLVIEIEDNGVGRDFRKKDSSSLDAKRKSHGMKITEERISLGRISDKGNPVILIQDLKDADGNGCGTRVTVNIPLENYSDESED